MGNSPLVLCPTELYGAGEFDELYEVEEHRSIGSGKFSTVHLCWKRDSPDVRYALKALKVDADDFAMVSRCKEEIEVLQVLGNHPGIITLIDVDESMSDSIRIVMDLCEGGELYDAIQEKKCYSEPDAKATIKNLLEAVAYVHSKGIMHRDLKPENILLVSKEKYTEVKISDFGLAKMSRDYPRRLPRSHSICGSDFYLAPEVIKQEEYGREIDIWAVGVIAYVLLSGSLPFFHQVLHKLYRQIVERDVSFPEDAWRNVSKGALDFILQILQVKAAERLTAEQALGQSWLQSAGQTSGSSFGIGTSFMSGFSGNELQRVLTNSASHAHPLEHAHKVDTSGGGSAAQAGGMPSLVASRPAANLFGTMPGMGGPMVPGAMMSQPRVNYTAGGSQMQSRAAQPMRYR